MRSLRLLRIVHTIGRYGLDEFLPRRGGTLARLFFRVGYFGSRDARGRGVRLRLALESLGPVFVKFGQLLSVRRDLIPDEIAEELAKLQDAVPPFTWIEVEAALARAYGKPSAEVFRSFDRAPVASASVAQVHFAVLPDGREVAVKILRPGIREVIAKDVALLHALASVLERFLADGRRLRLDEVVGEFETTIANELDLLREAGNASQLKRNFADARLLIVPEVYWDWCNHDVMVMQRIDGIAVNAVEELRRAGIDIKKLARDGVEIFYTQVFRDGFFHADMHPGNIFVAPDGRYCGVDFGIVGTLSEADKDYLAINMRAFFERDYRRAATAEGDLLRQSPDAPLRSRAALRHRGAAAAHVAHEDDAADRRARPPARSRPRSAQRRATDPGALHGRADRLAWPRAADESGSAVLGADPPAAAAADPSRFD